MTAGSRTFSTSAPARLGPPGCQRALLVHPEVYLASSKGRNHFDQHFGDGEGLGPDHFAARRVQRRARRDLALLPVVARGAGAHRRAEPGHAAARLPAGARRPRVLRLPRPGQERRSTTGRSRRRSRRFPRLLDRGRYATYLQRVPRRCSPRDQMLVQLFDDLRADPQAYADEVFGFLGVQPPRAASGRAEEPHARRQPTQHRAGDGGQVRVPAGQARRPAPCCARASSARSSSDRRSTGPTRTTGPTVDPALAAELRRRSPTRSVSSTALSTPRSRRRWGYEMNLIGEPDHA